MKVNVSLDDITIPKHLVEGLSSTQFSSELELVNTIRFEVHKIPMSREINSKIKNLLSLYGYVHLKGLNLGGNNIKEKKINLLIFACMLGMPTSHTFDESNFTWEVKTKDYSSNDYSFSSSFVPLHTDSFFSKKPEKYFFLYAHKTSLLDEGITTLADFFNIREQLLSSKQGTKYYEVLSKKLYPSRVPRIFNTNLEVNWSPIVFKDSIRFRMDRLEAAFDLIDKDYRPIMVEAIEYLNNIIQDERHINRIKLDQNDVILIDNGRMLHGRTEFTNADRTLIRIRFN
jgi:alpha-ketoglutarate-dependent taurine dioxygenase